MKGILGIIAGILALFFAYMMHVGQTEGKPSHRAVGKTPMIGPLYIWFRMLTMFVAIIGVISILKGFYWLVS